MRLCGIGGLLALFWEIVFQTYGKIVWFYKIGLYDSNIYLVISEFIVAPPPPHQSENSGEFENTSFFYVHIYIIGTFSWQNYWTSWFGASDPSYMEI